jgi:hypothetical protein
MQTSSTDPLNTRKQRETEDNTFSTKHDGLGPFHGVFWGIGTIIVLLLLAWAMFGLITTAKAAPLGAALTRPDGVESSLHTVGSCRWLQDDWGNQYEVCPTCQQDPWQPGCNNRYNRNNYNYGYNNNRPWKNHNHNNRNNNGNAFVGGFIGGVIGGLIGSAIANQNQDYDDGY